MAAALIAGVPGWAAAGTERGLLAGYEINGPWRDATVQVVSHTVSGLVALEAEGTMAVYTAEETDADLTAAANVASEAAERTEQRRAVNLSIKSLDPALLAMDAVEQQPLLKPIEPPAVTPTFDEPWDGTRGVVVGLKVRY